MSKEKLSVERSVAEKFVQLVQAGIAAWLEAGQLVAAEADKDPEFVEKLVDSVPGLTLETVLRFEAIGRGRVLPELLASGSQPGVRRLLRMPIDLQRRFVKEPVPLLVRASSGGWDTLQVDLRNLTQTQAVQVFGADGIRSEAAQRAYLEDLATKKQVRRVEKEAPYKVKGGKLIVVEQCTFTRKQLAALLAQMED